MVKALPAPDGGNKIHYDSEVKGFGCRVTAAGQKSFVLNYRTKAGRERRYTIGNAAHWTAKAAREEAKSLKLRIDRGEDPQGDLQGTRDAMTVTDLCDRFAEEHFRHLRPSTERDYRMLIRNRIEKPLGMRPVAEVAYSDIEALHRKISAEAPYLANRTVALLSKMFTLAVRWKWRADNPAKGIQRNQEVKRHRYLSGEELRRLTVALAAHDDIQAANIIRLLLLTGARRGEVQAARWDQFDLAAGVWTKPGATTKQKTEHRVPLSALARQLLVDLQADAHGPYVFPGSGGTGHRIEIKGDWARLCKAAGIEGVRLHDLRHTFASVLASAGLSLPVIGALLGHSQPATTARYAHLFDDPLRAATDRAAALITGQGDSAAVIDIAGGRRIG